MAIACVVGGPLSQSNWQEEVATKRSPFLEFSYFASRGSKLFSADISQRPLSRLISGVLGFRFGMANEVVKGVDPGEHIFCVSEEIGIPVSLAALCSRKKPKVLIGIHGHYFRNPKFALWTKLVRNNEQVQWLCLSNSLRSRLIEEFRVRPERCHVVGVAVDTEFFTPRPLDNSTQELPLVVSAGAAGRDYATLISAAQHIDARFAIASGSTWTQDAQTDGVLPRNVTMGSSGNYSNLRDLYARAQFVVVPLQDTFHASGYMVMVEAMSMAKPVIATRTQAPSDFVIDGETGLLVPPDDPTAMKEAIVSLLQNPALVRQMGLRARRLVEENYSLVRFYDRVGALCEVSRKGLRRTA